MPSKITIRLSSKDDLFQDNINTQLERSSITALTLKNFVKDSSFGSLLAGDSISGSKLMSDINGSKVVNETITGAVLDVGTSPVKGKIALSTITGANISNNSIGLNKITQITGSSILGNSSSSTGNISSISSTTDNTVLVRKDGALSFSTIDTSTIGSGVLSRERGGTGVNTAPTNGQILIGNTTSSNYTLANLTAGNNITITNGAGSITISGNTVPPGAIMPFAMRSAPSGWLVADGKEYSKTEYAALFAAIGTEFGETNGTGGTGTSHFRVPDLCGYFIRGFGTNSDTTASEKFGVKQADQIKSHTHGIGSGTSWVAGTSSGIIVARRDGGTPDSVLTSTNSGGGTETRPKNIALLYCIKT